MVVLVKMAEHLVMLAAVAAVAEAQVV